MSDTIARIALVRCDVDADGRIVHVHDGAEFFDPLLIDVIRSLMQGLDVARFLRLSSDDQWRVVAAVNSGATPAEALAEFSPPPTH